MMEGDWPSSYLSLREELLNAVRKQDSLFPVILTAFGVLAAFVTNGEVDRMVCRLLCVALIFVAIVFQCKTVQYRDTVYRIAAYLAFAEKEMKLSVSWENELIQFIDERTEYAQNQNAETKVLFWAEKTSRFLKDCSFTIFAIFAFVFLVIESDGLGAGWEGLASSIALLVVGVVLVVYSILLTICVRRDSDRRKLYIELWGKTRKSVVPPYSNPREL